MRLLSLILLSLVSAAPAAAQPTTLSGDLPRKDQRPLQAVLGLVVEYGSVRTSEGYRLRTILSRPAGTSARLPAIFLTQWVSCGSLDFAGDGSDLLRDIARRSGMVLIRVERAGTGDSEGPPCSALDYDTEVRHYREAFDQLAGHPWIDPARIVIFGSSLGATTAPLVAQGKKVAGVAVQGGGALTYLERMIAFDRLFIERSGRYRPEQLHDEMLKRIRFHTEYLLAAKTPQEIARRHPELADVWQTIRGGAEAPPHYGRPYAWHWQAARRNFLAAWQKVEAPVLAVYGEYDQFETRRGHELIVEAVNRVRPGSARLIVIPQADHEIDLYDTPEDAYAYRNPRPGRDLFLEPMIVWAREVTGLAPRRE
jgi:pimeloyl-ACP methyl ester carboxylesterase